jgi:hypothetical protein
MTAFEFLRTTVVTAGNFLYRPPDSRHWVGTPNGAKYIVGQGHQQMGDQMNSSRLKANFNAS